MTAIPEPAQPTVDAIFAAIEAERRSEYRGYGISASQLGTDCDRQLWLNLRWASPLERIDGRKLRIFERGNIEEDRVIADLRRAGLDVQDVDPATGKQWRFEIAGGWLRGKADGIVTGVIEAPKARHVLEVKCIKAADWRAIKKHTLKVKKPEHWHQLHSGMAGLGIDRGIYVAVNADTQEILTERLHLDHEEALRQSARVGRAVDDHDMPLGLMGDVNTEKQAEKRRATPPCRFCDHAALCFDRAFAERSCRTCAHFTFGDGPNGHCERFDRPLRPSDQQDGKDCPAHLYLPSIVPGEQIDADPDAETITYKMPDGSEWIDGGKELS